jgi:shikimate kinase
MEKAHRPLISTIPDEDLPEFIGKHLFERSFYYNQAQLRISCDNSSTEELALEIMNSLV